MTLRLVALLLLVSIGCSPALFSPVESEDPEVSRLRSEVAELERQARLSEAELERLRRQVSNLEAELAGPRPVLDDNIPGDGGVAEESIESSDIPPPPRAPREPLPPVSPPVAVGAVDRGPLPAEAQELYDRGYTFYHQSQYVDAESAFQQFLSAYPTSELADNAHYWIGESRFARTDYRGALAAFRETLNRYPEGNKVSDAMLKVGDTLARLGDVEGARDAYADVERRFPASAAAITAGERRNQLGADRD